MKQCGPSNGELKYAYDLSETKADVYVGLREGKMYAPSGFSRRCTQASTVLYHAGFWGRLITHKELASLVAVLRLAGLTVEVEGSND